jgi:uncharacterized protein YcfJ
MRKLALAAAIAAAISVPAFAQVDRPYDPNYRSTADNTDWQRPDSYRDGRYRPDNARVLESRPLYAAGEARQECWNERAGHYEELREARHDSVLNKGTALGALVGGIVGHQVSNGSGGTAAGAVLGGIAGNYINRRNNDDPQDDLDRTRCRVIAQDNAPVRGYEVRDAYRGQEYLTRMDHDPGTRLRLGRDVRDDGTPFDTADNSRYSWR